jgi:hypothetical protein
MEMIDHTCTQCGHEFQCNVEELKKTECLVLCPGGCDSLWGEVWVE